MIEEQTNDMSSYEKQIIREILANNHYGVNAVRSLKTLKLVFFENEKYSEIAMLIKAGRVDQIMNLESVQSAINNVKVREYLDIMIFKDQSNKNYIVTIYDSDLLEQDPQVIDIFELKEQDRGR